jgi:GT2 family glycosyltransferase
MSEYVTTGISDPQVFVLVPVHNRIAITRKFLSCLSAQTYRRCRLVLIDDGSTDGTAEMVLRQCPTAVILTGNGRLWWSGCMQRAYRWLLSHECEEDDIVFIANDDIAFGPEFISEGVKALQKLPSSLLGARVRDPKTEQVRESGVHADLKRFTFEVAERPEEVNCLPTRALFLRWKDMKQVGRFHPNLLPHYFADYEYTLRATKLGMRCVTSPDLAIIADFGSTGYHDLDSLVGWRFLRRLFSVKTPLNPLYRTSFVVLASPGIWKLVNILNVWMRASFRIVWQGIFRLRFPRTAINKASF